MNVLAYGKKVQGIEGLINSFNASEFDSPLRSTVPFLEYWRDCEASLSKWEARLQLKASSADFFEFEFALHPRRGRGKASFTDLAISVDDAFVAVEAKYLEPPYETCVKWLGEKPSDNRVDVLKGWLEILGERIGRAIKQSEVMSLPYQLVHRTASACSDPTKQRAIVAYQIFDPSKRGYYEKILTDMMDVTGNSVEAYLHVSQFQPTPDYAQLMDSFKNGARKMSSQVIEQLENGPIGAFGGENLARVA